MLGCLLKIVGIPVILAWLFLTYVNLPHIVTLSDPGGRLYWGLGAYGLFVFVWKMLDLERGN